MPTYVYRRSDGTTFEIQQRITEPALATCPTTGQPVSRVISASAGLVFKGSGFYLTDYARASQDTPAATTKKEDTAKKEDAAPSTPATPPADTGQ
jgi:putative FmdB family regulatory protein